MLKRHKKNRPWDLTKRREHGKWRHNLLLAIDAGLSDEKLCVIYKLSPSYMKWFREVDYDLWQQRISESLKRLEFCTMLKTR